MKRALIAVVCVCAAVVTVFAQDPVHDLSVHLRLEFQTGPNAIPPNKHSVVELPGRVVYLLDADPAELLDAAGLKVDRFESYGESHRVALLSDYLASADSEFHGRAERILKPHVVRSAKTDAAGKVLFSQLPTGIYYLAAAAQDSYPYIWNLRLEIRSSVRATLDQSNRWQPANDR